MEYSNQNFSYDHYDYREKDLDTEDSSETRRVSYSRKRAVTPSRRRTTKRVSSTPVCGMNGRRGKRWSW